MSCTPTLPMSLLRLLLAALPAVCLLADCRKFRAPRAEADSRSGAGLTTPRATTRPLRQVVLTTIVEGNPQVETLRVGSDGTFHWTNSHGLRHGAVPAADVDEVFGWVDGPVWRTLAEKRPVAQPRPTTYRVEAAGQRIERSQPVPYDDLFFSVLQAMLDLREVAALVERPDGIQPVCRVRRSGGIAGVHQEFIIWADGIAERPDEGTGKRVFIEPATVTALRELFGGTEWRALPNHGAPAAQDAITYTVIVPSRRVQWSDPGGATAYAKVLELLRSTAVALGYEI
jgi:hypothetical protein